MKNPRLLLWGLLGLMGLLAVLIVVFFIRNLREDRSGEEPRERAAKEGGRDSPALTPSPSPRGERGVRKEAAAGEPSAKQAKSGKPEKPVSATARPKPEPAKKAVGPAAGSVPKAEAPRGDGGRPGPTGDPAKDFGIPAVEEPTEPDAKPSVGTPPNMPLGEKAAEEGTGETPVAPKE
jgi:hypothetical protein